MTNKTRFALLLAVCGVAGAILAFDAARVPGDGEEVPTPDFEINVVAPRKSGPTAKTARFEREQWVDQEQILAKLPLVSLGKTKLMTQWGSPPMVFELQFSPDGKLLAVGADSTVDVRDVRGWKSKGEIPGSPRIAWAPNSRLLAVDWRQGVNIHQMPKGNVSVNLLDGSGIGHAGKDGSAGVFGPLLFSADSSKLATLGEDPQSNFKLGDGPNTETAYVREIALKSWECKTGKSLLVKLGPYSNGNNYLARVTDDPAQIEFAGVIGSRYAVSNTRPPIYIYNARGSALDSDYPFAAIQAQPPGYVGAIAGNASIYGLIDNSHPGSRVQILRTRDQKLLASLPMPNRITAVAISPDAKTLAVAADYATRKTFPDGSTMELSRSRVLIYHLSTSLNETSLLRPQIL